MKNRGKTTEKLRKVRGPDASPTTVIGDLVTGHRGAARRPNETKNKKGLSAPVVAPGNPKSGGPTSPISLEKFENYPTKGGH